MDNISPNIRDLTNALHRKDSLNNSPHRELIDQLEIFDPEHPFTLEQLGVTSLDQIRVNDSESTVIITFTPTIPHCSMATLIGLCIRVKLIRSLPERFKIDIFVAKGSHSSEEAINKQLNDKERVAAALENGHLITVVNRCLNHSDPDFE